MGSTPSSPVLAEGFVLHGRASESTWVSSLSFTADTEQAQLLTPPHHPAWPQAHGPGPSHAQHRQLPWLPARHPQVPMLSQVSGSGTMGWGHGQDVPREYLPPLLRLMKHRMSKMRSTTMALMKPMNQPLVASQREAAHSAWEGRRGRRLRPSPGLNAGAPGGTAVTGPELACQSPALGSDSSSEPLAPSGQPPTLPTRACQGHPMSRTPIPEIPHTRDPLSGTPPRQGSTGAAGGRSEDFRQPGREVIGWGGKVRSSGGTGRKPSVEMASLATGPVEDKWKKGLFQGPGLFSITGLGAQRFLAGPWAAQGWRKLTRPAHGPRTGAIGPSLPSGAGAPAP